MRSCLSSVLVIFGALVPSSAWAERPAWAWRPGDTVAARMTGTSTGAFSPQGMSPRGTAFSLDSPGYQAALIDGIAAFMVDRAQREATLALMERVRGDLCAQTSTSFPTACSMLKAQEGRFVASAIPTLPELFRADLESLPERTFAGLADRGPLGRLGLVLLTVARRIRDGEHPAPALVTAIDRNVPWGPTSDCRVQPTDYGLYALRSMLVVMQSPTGPLLGTDELLKIRGKLLDELRKQLIVGCQPAVQAFASLEKLAVPVDALLRSGEQVERRRKALEDARSKGTDLLRPGLELAAAGFDLVESAAALARVASGDDSAAARLIETSAAHAEALSSALAERAYARAVVALMSWVDDLQLSWSVPPVLRQFVALATGLASATTAEEARAALESAAAPVGSYREKRGRDASTHLSINGYLGGSAGMEWLADGALRAGLRRDVPVVGVFAPIGLELSFGVPTPVLSSVGVFISVIDLGVLTQIRLESVESNGLRVDEAAELGFAQVFSPGLFLTLGITEVAPVTLGAGVQLTPELRAIERLPAVESEVLDEEQRFVTEVPALRAQVFLAIDLVIFAL